MEERIAKLIILSLLIVIILYKSYTELMMAQKGQTSLGGQLDEFQMKKLHQGLSYSYVLLNSGILIGLAYANLNQLSLESVSLLLFFIVFLVGLFYDLWKILTGCYFAQGENELRGVRSGLLTACLYLWALVKMSPDSFYRYFWVLMALSIFVINLAKIYRYHLNQRISD